MSDIAAGSHSVRAQAPVDVPLFDANLLPSTMALLDREGQIVSVNRAWRQFAHENGADPATECGIGLNYLEICRSADDPVAAKAHEGLRAVIEGRSAQFTLLYACHSPTQLRWFQLLARRLDGHEGALVAHFDATDQCVATAHLRIQATLARALSSSAPLVEACRQLALAVCQELQWDYAGVWTVETLSCTLRCRDIWSRPELRLTDLERTVRAAALGPGVGLPGRAWSTGQVQWATDLDIEPEASAPKASPWRIMPPVALKAGFRSALSFPLKCGDDVLAVVDLFSTVRRAPDRQLMELLETAGNQLALWALRQRAEECARTFQRDAEEARAQLESVLDYAPAVVLMVDQQRLIRFVNRPPDDRPKEQIIGTPWSDFVTTEQREQAEAALSAVLVRGVPQHYESCGRDPSGAPRWYLTHMGPIRTAKNISGAVIIAQDITETKAAQADLIDAQRLAAVGTLAAGVAHEINTPVQFVNDSIHFLRDACSDLFGLLGLMSELKNLVGARAAPELLSEGVARVGEAEEAADLPYLLEHTPKAFERAIEGLERVTTIVRSMKEFAHPAQREMAPADLNRAIETTVTVARNEYKYVADVVTDLGEIPMVSCHVGDINQVILNILVNAAHAIEDVVRGTESRGTITIRTRSDAENVLISIADTGSGIPEHARARIFDPFFTTKEVGRGTGQGLAISRRAVREHEGDLTFETELGRGTTFFIRLPIQGPRAAGEQA